MRKKVWTTYLKLGLILAGLGLINIQGPGCDKTHTRAGLTIDTGKSDRIIKTDFYVRPLPYIHYTIHCQWD
ncbi:uncharacterized protein EV154DRAFT_527964 [Mucor mucedo]|uniref:uncharacterized protein n=1 Tax=Mucor mucedo TaxID=29922 RepID=UPI00221F26A7|nr:uncharacterized protein EV154DRAFT_527964 [Mucor mucedo]KAI7873513.1 hypothetical protein EV154DRAFT_527964 [Mucor mucedo]